MGDILPRFTLSQREVKHITYLTTCVNILIIIKHNNNNNDDDDYDNNTNNTNNNVYFLFSFLSTKDTQSTL